MPQQRLMKFLTQALAIVCVIAAHGFALALPHPPSLALGFAYGASALILAVSAALLWRRTMDLD